MLTVRMTTTEVGEDLCQRALWRGYAHVAALETHPTHSWWWPPNRPPAIQIWARCYHWSRCWPLHRFTRHLLNWPWFHRRTHFHISAFQSEAHKLLRAAMGEDIPAWHAGLAATFLLELWEYGYDEWLALHRANDPNRIFDWMGEPQPDVQRVEVKN